MIKVEVTQSLQNGRIETVTISGHSFYDVPGKDIVCAAVSALAIGAVNSTEALLGIDLHPTESSKSGGYLSWVVPVIADDLLDQKLQLLMGAMLESMKSIEESYNRYLSIRVKE